MKWSLSGWSDWVYCVQNEMSEVGLQEKGTVWDEVLLVREVHQKQKGIEVTGEAPMSQIDLTHVALAVGLGPGVQPPPYWPFLVTNPVELSLGLPKTREGGRALTHYLTLKSRSCQRFSQSCPKWPTGSRKPLPICM